MGTTKYLAYLVILCFERWCPKQTTVARLKVKILSPKNFWPGDATDSEELILLVAIGLVSRPTMVEAAQVELGTAV